MIDSSMIFANETKDINIIRKNKLKPWQHKKEDVTRISLYPEPSQISSILPVSTVPQSNALSEIGFDD